MSYSPLGVLDSAPSPDGLKADVPTSSWAPCPDVTRPANSAMVRIGIPQIRPSAAGIRATRNMAFRMTNGFQQLAVTQAASGCAILWAMPLVTERCQSTANSFNSETCTTIFPPTPVHSF